MLAPMEDDRRMDAPPRAVSKTREARIARETAALRDNLKKRKDQARAKKSKIVDEVRDTVSESPGDSTEEGD
jgi:hypothetical protein